MVREGPTSDMDRWKTDQGTGPEQVLFRHWFGGRARRDKRRTVGGSPRADRQPRTSPGRVPRLVPSCLFFLWLVVHPYETRNEIFVSKGLKDENRFGSLRDSTYFPRVGSFEFDSPSSPDVSTQSSPYTGLPLRIPRYPMTAVEKTQGAQTLYPCRPK